MQLSFFITIILLHRFVIFKPSERVIKKEIELFQINLSSLD